MVNNFWNSYTLIQTATDASFFAIMAIGATIVIISGGIDLSVGSIYALSGVAMALFLRAVGPDGRHRRRRCSACSSALGVGLACGLLNGALVVGLRVHPFIITLGTMWVLRGIAFVATKAESILVPASLTAVTKASLGLGGGLYPVPMLCDDRAHRPRHDLSHAHDDGAAHLRVRRQPRSESVRRAVAARAFRSACSPCRGSPRGSPRFSARSFYGSVSSGDAQGYELYVIASAVVGGASLLGGKGSALGAMLGALLIVLIRQSIRTLHFDQNYEWIVIGCAIIIAVVVDQWSTRLTARRLSRAAEPCACCGRASSTTATVNGDAE